MNFASILAALAAGQAGGDRLITLANTAPDPAEYLFLGILPQRRRNSYQAKSGSMKIISTMAGMVGMDSPYPSGTAIEFSDFSENTIKIAQAVGLNEEQIREVQGILRDAQLGEITGADPADILQNAALNLYRKGVVQALDDTEEYLRAQAIATGKLQWTFNGKTVAVDYGIPADQKKAYAATDGFGGTTSKFWDAIRWGRKTVKSIRGFVMSDDTLEMVINNDANRITVVSESESPEKNIRVVTVRRAVRNAEGITVGFDQDQRSTVTLIGYRREGRIVTPGAVGGVTAVQMFPDGVVSVVGNNDADNLISVDGTPERQNALGYTHIGPTVEGGGRVGRWGRVYTPEGAPWSARAEGVSNPMIVIEEVKKLALITTAMV